MKHKEIYSIFILSVFLIFVGCEAEEDAPEFSQPIIENYVEKNTFVVNGESITTGPLKDYESDSEVVYRLTVTSDRKLSAFTVTTSSDAFSASSGIIKTVPENVIDNSGNFIKKVNEVVVYYAYHIHPLTSASTSETVTFTFLNDINNASFVYHTFKVIKKGSTAGNLLNVIDLSWTNTKSLGIGTQESLYDETGGYQASWRKY
ncbi:MAG: hypothetical protein AB2L24_19260 [Mangrovibacterium sp.]